MLNYPTPCFDVLVRLYLGYIRNEKTMDKIKENKIRKNTLLKIKK